MTALLTLIESGDEVVLLGVLEGDLEGVEHDPAELLDVVLLPGLAAVPAERHRQLGGLHGQTVGGLRGRGQIQTGKGHSDQMDGEHCLRRNGQSS